MFPMVAPPPPPSCYTVPTHRPRPFYHADSALPRPLAAVPVQSVWAWNFDQESANLRSFAAGARYVAVDVHYPGVIHRPGKDHNALTLEQRYALVKANVDALKPLQVGIAVCDHQGRIFAWEFNLCDFRRLTDPHDENSLTYLAGRGLHLETLAKHGVDAHRLGTMLVHSGLIGPLRNLSWITYAGAYHVAYLLKIVTGGGPLPHDVAGFVGAVRKFLGDQVYDVATMAALYPALPVGLDRIAAHLGVHPPLGSPRLAAAAGVRALQVFRKLEDGEFGGNLEGYRGLLKGLQC